LKFFFVLVIQFELTNQLIEMAGFSFLFSFPQPDKRWAGISLLGVTCEECSSDRFEESYTVWFQKLLTSLQVISRPFPWLHIILLLAFLYSSFWEYIIYCLVPVYNILCLWVSMSLKCSVRSCRVELVPTKILRWYWYHNQCCQSQIAENSRLLKICYTIVLQRHYSSYLTTIYTK